MIDWIGRTLGRVQIRSLLARGGMAEVYLGTHTTLHREVAVKILRNPYLDDPRLLERFALEARAVAQLRHPNIVQVFDFDTVDDQPYIVMEYISGPSLSKYLAALHARSGRLELPLVSRLLNGVAGALQYAHESGVVHRDVKPGNILLTSRSIQVVPGETMPLDIEPVLTDFGLVRFLDSARQTTTGQTAGTPAYMSPEQAMGFATDGRTDIYSLGIVLYEMLSGNVPFDGETTMSVLLKHLNEAPAPVPGLSPALQDVLDQALAKNADDRFQEPREFATAFNTALKETSSARTLASIPHVAEGARGIKPVPAPQKRRWAPALLAGALIALMSASLVFGKMLPLAANESPTAGSPSLTPILSIPVTLGPTSILSFQDGNAVLARATLVAQAMQPPPAGSEYRVWLVGAGERLPLGILRVDQSGKGELTFDDPRRRNLLGTYNGVEITVEPAGNGDPDRSAAPAFAYTLPDAGLVYLRRLMVAFPGAPDHVGLIQGLTANATLMDEAARAMLSAQQAGDEAAIRANAEQLMNLLVGAQSPDHKDWDGNGHIADPGDGYGLLLNSDNLGYIQAVYSHADYAVNSPGASRNMIVYGDDVKACAQNLARWAPELRDNLAGLLDADGSTAAASAAQRSAELAAQMLRGVDLDEDGQVESISGECGAQAAYDTVYHMADMPLLPVNPLETPPALSPTVTASATATPILPVGVTPTRQPSQNGAAPTLAPTSQPPSPGNNNSRPTKEPRPTKEARPTKEPNNPPGSSDAQPTKKNP